MSVNIVKCSECENDAFDFSRLPIARLMIWNPICVYCYCKIAVKPKKQEPETFDFYEAMRRMYDGHKIEMVNEPGEYYFFSPIDGRLMDKDGIPRLFNKKNLSEIWRIYKEQPKTFGWDEAYKLMKEGKKIAKKSWADKKKYLTYNQHPFFNNLHAMIISDKLDSEFKIGTTHLESTDWYVYEE
jgi:hypothetical protein